MNQSKSADTAATPKDRQAQVNEIEAAQPLSSPATDPTNPHNQELTGDWVANERASDRRNSEPGMTDRERKRRKY